MNHDQMQETLYRASIPVWMTTFARTLKPLIPAGTDIKTEASNNDVITKLFRRGESARAAAGYYAAECFGIERPPVEADNDEIEMAVMRTIWHNHFRNHVVLLYPAIIDVKDKPPGELANELYASGINSEQAAKSWLNQKIPGWDKEKRAEYEMTADVLFANLFPSKVEQIVNNLQLMIAIEAAHSILDKAGVPKN